MGLKNSKKSYEEDDTGLPYAPAYPFPEECNVCEIDSKDNCKLEDKHFVLCVRPDNSNFWKEIKY